MNQPAINPSTRYYPLARAITLLSYLVILACIFYGVWFFGPSDIAAKLVLWLLCSSGLLLIVWGLFRGKKRSYIWLCYILLMYFVFCVQFLFSGAAPDSGQSPAAIHEIIAMVAIVAGFCCAIIASRWTPVD